ncbi:MAG: hypothetical protein Q8Q52_08700 [Acidimicrobiia bacterium]|jgi:hypothetical protein|nr:hypothetical protein [Acidimicrobiia bacterium]
MEYGVLAEANTGWHVAAEKFTEQQKECLVEHVLRTWNGDLDPKASRNQKASLESSLTCNALGEPGAESASVFRVGKAGCRDFQRVSCFRAAS